MDNDKIDFYKWINKKVIEKLKRTHFENQKDINLLILYDFVSDYFDVKDNKVRIGVQKITDRKISILTKRLRENLNNQRFDIVDMRMTLKFVKNSPELELLFKFANDVLDSDKKGYVIGFIDGNDDTIDNIKTILARSQLYIKHTTSLDNYADQYKRDHKLKDDDLSKEMVIVIEKKLN
jgi:hypothetical protein